MNPGEKKVTISNNNANQKSITHHVLGEIRKHAQVQHLCWCLLHLLLALHSTHKNMRTNGIMYTFSTHISGTKNTALFLA